MAALTDDRWTLEQMLHSCDEALKAVRAGRDRRPLAILRRRVLVKLELLEVPA